MLLQSFDYQLLARHYSSTAQNRKNRTIIAKLLEKKRLDFRKHLRQKYDIKAESLQKSSFLIIMLLLASQVLNSLLCSA